MLRKTILTAVLLLVLYPSESRSQYSGEVTLDPVIGQTGPGKIGIGQIILPIRASYTGPGGTYAIGSNSFRLYSDDLGSLSAIEGERLAIWTSLFTTTYQGERLRLSSENDWFQQPIPTPPFDIITPSQVAGIWFASMHLTGMGMPAGYSEVIWNIKFVTSASDIGNVICVDTGAPPMQAWEWASGLNSWFPVFNNGSGPVCFTIEAVGLTPVSNPPGSPVDVDVNESLTMTFDNVTSDGVTTVTSQTTGPVLPGGYQILGELVPTYYDIETTAGYSGDITVCFTYDENQISGLESDLTLWHWTGNPLTTTDITSSVDEVANVICGVTSSLSLFAMAEPPPPCCAGIVGDANMSAEVSGEISVGDIGAIVNMLFGTGEVPVGQKWCFDEADANLTAATAIPPHPTTIADISVGDIGDIVDHLFGSGDPLPPCP